MKRTPTAPIGAVLVMAWCPACEGGALTPEDTFDTKINPDEYDPDTAFGCDSCGAKFKLPAKAFNLTNGR